MSTALRSFVFALPLTLGLWAGDAHAGGRLTGPVEGPMPAATKAPETSQEIARFALVIANNETLGDKQGIKPLRYADDDGARMAELWRELGADVELLTVFDQSSQARFPELVKSAQQPSKAKLDAAEAEIADSQKSFEAVVEILPRATAILDYTAVHAGHALKRWESRLGPPPRDWGELSDEDRRRYQEFVDISANQLAVATIDVTKLMSSRGGEREELIKVNDEVLKQAKAGVESLA